MTAQGLLCAACGPAGCPARNGLEAKNTFVLSSGRQISAHMTDEGCVRFVWPVQTARALWGHPILLGCLTGACAGDERICAFLREHRRELCYATPERSLLLGLEFIAQGEASGHLEPMAAALGTAFALRHMAEGAEDPFILGPEELEAVERIRTGALDPAERIRLYRKALDPGALDRLRRMEDSGIETEFFKLIEEVSSC